MMVWRMKIHYADCHHVLCMDPSHLPKEPKYIFPVDSRQRSLGDRMLPITGKCYLLGIGNGGMCRLYEGLLAIPTGELRIKTEVKYS